MNWDHVILVSSIWIWILVGVGSCRWVNDLTGKDFVNSTNAAKIKYLAGNLLVIIFWPALYIVGTVYGLIKTFREHN